MTGIKEKNGNDNCNVFKTTFDKIQCHFIILKSLLHNKNMKEYYRHFLSNQEQEKHAH